MKKVPQLARVVCIAVLGVAMLGPALGSLPTPNSTLGTYVYPKNNQSKEQQTKDENTCYSSAEQQTGVYPYGNPSPTPAAAATQSGGTVKGGAKGAAAGAAIGAVAGNAGQGAAIGAVAGGLAGHRQQRYANAQAQAQAEAQAKAQHQQHLDKLRRAYTACLDSKGYAVR